MEILVIITFLLGYTAITLEHQLKVDKLIPALLMMTISWAAIALGIDGLTYWYGTNPVNGETSLFQIQLSFHEQRLQLLDSTLLHHFGKTAEILIFLMGAMAIVEMIDHFHGFEVFKRWITASKKFSILCIVSLIAFLLSAIIDNLTATIVLITILRKLVNEQKERLWFASFIVIAANAGGAWSPIGDVTTTMLWMANKVSTGKLVIHLLIPSLINILVPLVIAYFLPVFKGELKSIQTEDHKSTTGTLMLFFGLTLIIFVPVFKVVTHLPPYLGMMLSLALFAIVAEILTNRSVSFTQMGTADNLHEGKGPTLKALSKIEMPSILFFLGILMTVAALETLGSIDHFGKMVSEHISQDVFVTLLGISSAIIDNVPLVAASIGMFPDAMDANVWHFIAYAAGTGGSILIIGSAAGVVAMGMEKISFGWYLKHITFIALLGYLGGVASFLWLT
jgi:Na+/H+ antiporter NhaD/arsenite permease-like protein